MNPKSLREICEYCGHVTIRKALVSYFVERGMFESMATDVTSHLISTFADWSGSSDYQMIWDRPMNEYPAPLFGVLEYAMLPAVDAWLGEHKPNAWFRPTFQRDNQSSEAIQ